MPTWRANQKSSKFTPFLALLIALAPTRSCDSGCLSCNPSHSTCDLCDAISGFSKTGPSCLLKAKDNCRLISPDGQCKICQPGFEPSNGNCIAKKNPAPANSCNIYQTSKSCSPAITGSFFHDMLFQAVHVVIGGCAEYSERNVCRRCAPPLVLAHDRKACLPPGSSDPHCGAFTSFECRECSKGYLLDANGYAGAWRLDSGNSTAPNDFFASYLSKGDSGLQTKGYSCLPESLAGCREYRSFGQCAECEAEFFATAQGTCQRNPLPSVENCARYNFRLECQECRQGFYLLHPFACRPVAALPNCLEYDGTSSGSKCAACQAAFYLAKGESGKPICVPRNASLAIVNCEFPASDKDSCAKCKEGYLPSADGAFCFRVPVRCQSFSLPASPAEVSQCSKCENGHVQTSQDCQPGPTQNCREYEANACRVCDFGFLLSNSKCAPVPSKLALQFCREADPANGALCNSCEPTAELFRIERPCLPLKSAVPHCGAYSSADICAGCEENYELTPDFLCTKKSPEVICHAEASPGVCADCKPGYYPTPAGLCAPYLELFYYNCDETEELGGGLINCLTCSALATPALVDGLVTVCESPFADNAALSPAPQPGCLRYNTDGSCRECGGGQALMQSDGSCQPASACTKGLILERVEAVSGIYSVTGKRVCPAADSVANCKYYAANFERDDTGGRPDYVCAACKDGYLAQAPLGAGQAHTYDLPAASSDFLVRRPAVTLCVLRATAEQTNYISKGDLANCEVVLIDQSMNYNTFTVYFGCYQCKFGFSGPPTVLDAKYFIPICSKITECNAAVRFSGLSALPRQILPLAGDYPNLPFDGFLTCHKCLGAGAIPVFAATEGPYTVKTDKSVAKNDLVGFRLSFSPPSASEDSAEASMLQTQCLPTAYLSGLAAGSFPENCGAAMVLANKAKALYLSAGTSILCVACAPGFRATPVDAGLFPGIAFAVAACAKIANCKSSTRFNGCSECEAGFSLGFDPAGQRPLVDACVPTGPDCLYGAGAGAGAGGQCAVCRDGHFLHANGQCYAADLKNCNLFSVKSVYNYRTAGMAFPRQMDFLLAQVGFSLGSGCLKCDSGYRAVQRFFLGQRICMKNPVMGGLGDSRAGTAGDDFSQTGFVANCQNYHYVGEVKCKICREGFVITVDGRFCYPASRNLADCVLALNYKECQNCASGFFLRENSTCKIGEIANCAVYANPSTCSKCFYGHVLFNNACFLIPEINCETMDLSQMAASKIMKCQACKSFYFNFANPDSSDFAMTICLPFDKPIENCQKMLRDASGKLICDFCTDDYYLHPDKRSCLARRKISNCALVHRTQNFCERCADGHFLTQNFEACLPNPTGLQFCEHYQTEAICRECQPDAFLANGKCPKRPEESSVSECAAYAQEGSGQILCVRCLPGRFLAGNACFVVQQKNCRIAKSSNECETCDDFSELKLDGQGFSSCEVVIIPGCLVQGKIGGKVICRFCNFGYFLFSDFECRKSKIAIPGCLFHGNAEDVCKKCGPGKVLSSDGKRCQDALIYGQLVPSNCADIRFLENPICQECKFGYYFDSEKKCVKCKTGENCLYCDKDAPEKCLVCRPGTYQLADLSCVKWDGGSVAGPASSGNGTNAEGSSFAGFLFVVIVVILLLDY